MRRKTWKWLALAALSVPITAFLAWTTFPAAPLLGPMIAAVLFGVSGHAERAPRLMFIGAQSIIGCLIARTVTSSIVATIAHDWWVMLLVVATTVIAAAIVGWVLVKFGALPGTTAAWGSSPGAASAMIAMAEEYGTDIQLVAFMLYLRVVIVVLVASLVSRLLGAVPPPFAMPSLTALFATRPLPFAGTLLVAGGGAFIGRRFHVPGGAVLVPMLIGAVLHSNGILPMTLPPWVIGAAYAAVGWYVGLGFTRRVFVHAFRAIPQLVLATLLLIGLCMISAWLLTHLLHTDPLTAYLATSPGGVDAMAIIALATHARVSFVMAIQILRVFVVILVAPKVARYLCRFA